MPYFAFPHELSLYGLTSTDQVKQINALKSIETERTKIIKKHLQEEEKRQELLLNLMRKELEFTTRQNRKKSILEEKRLLKAKMLGKL